ncbi:MULTISPECIES: helix-turn-helix domain-containing protein [unclassified Myroides]|uniref:helix-turn-helix domain-containing protein n=1 Tax=unclassified Myroides TaxID=2642485 RepID=UPI003D2F8202
MPLQNVFLIVLLPIVLYEILIACFKCVLNNKRIVYKTCTWFIYFVLIQLVLLVLENKFVNHMTHFPIWGLMFLFYGPYVNLILATWRTEVHQQEDSKFLGDFYSMMCVFISCTFVSFMTSDLLYVTEVIGGVLAFSSIYYGIRLGRKWGKISVENQGEGLQKKERNSGRWVYISLSFILVLFFFILSQDVKLSGLLFLFLWYVSLVFLRKNIEDEQVFLANQRKEIEQIEAEWEDDSEDDFEDGKEFEYSKYGQTKLNEIVLQRCNLKVKDIIIDNKAFLDANFKMTDLTARTKISRYYLAQYFHVIHQMNFREYINKLRIDHVVQYINNCNKKEKLSVNDLFLESAFNSKTSFFKSFKQVLGCTPFEYLKKCQD